MAIDYAAAQKSFKKHKGLLTRAKNSGDPHRVVKAVNTAFGEWDAMGIPYPDSHHTWSVAKQDAELQIRRGDLFNDRRVDPRTIDPITGRPKPETYPVNRPVRR